MSLKAGRVGVAPDQVDEFGKVKSDATTGYTKQEADAKFETKDNANMAFLKKEDADVDGWNNKVSETLLKDTVGWVGKNLNNSKYVNEISNAVTFTANNNRSISVNGTATGGNAQTSDDAENRFVANVTAQVILSGVLSNAPDGLEIFPWDYTINSRPYTDSSQTTLQNNSVTASRSEISFYMIAGHTYYIRVRLTRNKTANNVTIYPMIRDAHITDDTYEPYHESVEEVIEKIPLTMDLLTGSQLKAVVADSSDFADFKTKVAAM